ncbi:MAG TPA: tripartite tricarboxylate transporter substrate binding protein [Ottowia sp.]|nr:tripartite tricarboxylate transporter substrate binding protein [Ottowia sp.]
MNIRLTPVLAVAAATLLTLPAAAQDYPSKPITLVVPFGPGSGTDQMARLYAKALGDELKVPIVVENKGGASGFIAAQLVAKAAPDGYTLMMTTNTTHAANEHLFKKLPYDPVKDFAPIELLATGQMLLLVQPNSPYKSVADLLAAARKEPGKLDFGSGSSSSQVAGYALQQMAHVDMVNVPYKSNPQAITDLIGGQLNFMFADTPTAMPQGQGGKLRPLATSGAKRVAALPDVPTVAEAGVKGYDVSYWFAAYAPAGTPPAIVTRLNQVFAKASATDEVKAYMSQTSSTLTSSTPEGLARFQAAESKKWGEVIRAAGIQPQ